MYSAAVARHALTHRSKGQMPRSHGYENHDISDDGRGTVTLYVAVLSAAVASVGLHVNTTACFLVLCCFCAPLCLFCICIVVYVAFAVMTSLSCC